MSEEKEKKMKRLLKRVNEVFTTSSNEPVKEAHENGAEIVMFCGSLVLDATEPLSLSYLMSEYKFVGKPATFKKYIDPFTDSFFIHHSYRYSAGPAFDKDDAEFDKHEERRKEIRKLLGRSLPELPE